MQTLALVAILLGTNLVLATPARAGGGNDILTAVTALRDHITGTTRLTASQIDAYKRIIDANRQQITANKTNVKACFDLVTTYDRILGPLWVSRGQFDRRQAVNDIHWTTYHVMQYIVDEVYTARGVANYEAELDGFTFGCSANFPGAVSAATPRTTHAVRIDGSYPDTYGRPTMHEDRPARKPTGAYLAPGAIATITVPSTVVGKGYTIRVGAHSWDMSNRPWVRRLDRCTTVYPIHTTVTKVANPLGGGIYIEVPLGANAGLVTVSAKNVVRSPYFSAKSFHATTLAEWRNTERHHQAPWADFQSDKFMMQVPSSWIYKLSDPVTLLKDWDTAMDTTNQLMGFPRNRGKESLYAQVDVLFRASVYAPGYPSVNASYNPRTNYGGNHGHHLLRGPQFARNYEFHEMGHGYLFPKFPGETESNVNLLHVAVWNQKFGSSLNAAFRASAGFNSRHRTLENTAVAWMMCQNFKHRRVMATAEKAYQLKGYAKFVEIARLYGWDKLGDYWKSFNDDYENQVASKTDIDSLLFRLSRSVGVDVTPLFHFWGVHPTSRGALRLRLAAANLKPSPAILATLRRYEALVPANNLAYRTFALNWWGRTPSSNGYWTERDHALIWSTYDASYAAEIQANVRHILGLYFDSHRAMTTNVGTGCIASGKPPLLVGSTFVIGQSGMLVVTDAQPGVPGVIMLGFPDAGRSIGWGCKLYVDTSASMVPIFATVNSAGLLLSPMFKASTSLPPGISLGAQGGITNAATSPFGLALSNGLVLKIGY